MKKKSSFIFPGQGVSLQVGVAKDLYENFDTAKQVFLEVDDAIGQSLSQMIFKGPLEQLQKTENSQPALMAVSVAVARILEIDGKYNISKNIDYMAGHSLGEYSALTTAKILTLSDTAKLLKIRGKAMQEAVPSGQGAMVVILGLEQNKILKLMQQNQHGKNCSIANDNSSSQVVISGHKESVHNFSLFLKEKGAKKCIPLPVSAPFHCPLMKPAAKTMENALSQIKFNDSRTPILANVTAQPVIKGQLFENLLTEQITKTVRWRETMAYMANKDVKQFIELGSGQVLSNLAKRSLEDIESFSIGNIQEIEKFLS